MGEWDFPWIRDFRSPLPSAQEESFRLVARRFSLGMIRRRALMWEEVHRGEGIGLTRMAFEQLINRKISMAKVS